MGDSHMLWVFSEGYTTLGPIDKNLLGGKGAGLIEMARDGLPVPPGIVIPVPICEGFYLAAGKEAGKVQDEYLNLLVADVLEQLHAVVAKGLPYMPLLSVRSGARVSMPGMMDTILNVGLTADTLPLWRQKIGPKPALDCFRRLYQMYGTTVMGIKPERFHAILKDVMVAKYDQPAPPKTETDLSITHLTKLIQRFDKLYQEQTKQEFPKTLEAQLKGAIGAVFKSWNSERAIEYRKINKIPDNWYTACTVQTMVFGNMNNKSATGVLFTRDPSTGEKVVKGEFAICAQGEDVVSGTVTPKSLKEMVFWNAPMYDQLFHLATNMEKKKRDMQDMEFTIEDGKLWILQTRTGKRSAAAAFKIAYDMVKDGIISKDEALKRVTPAQYKLLTKQVIDPSFTDPPVGIGIPASNGIAMGKIWFTSEKSKKNPGGLLVTKETVPEDFPGMAAAAGILTQTGGLTSHAAVVGRGMEKVCVVGCTSMKFTSASLIFQDAEGKSNLVVVEGEELTIDGATGRVWFGKVPVIGGVVPDYVKEMLSWGMAEQECCYEPEPLVDALEQLPEEGEIHLSCRKFNSRNDFLGLISFLALERPKLTGVITFKTEVESQFDDSTLLKFMGNPKQQSIGAFEPSWLAGIKVPVSLAQNWTLQVDPDIKHPFRKVKMLVTLKDLLTVSGYYEVHPALVTTLADQGVKLDEMLDLVQKGGQVLKKIKVSRSYDELVFSILGK